MINACRGMSVRVHSDEGSGVSMQVRVASEKAPRSQGLRVTAAAPHAASWRAALWRSVVWEGPERLADGVGWHLSLWEERWRFMIF